MMFPYAIQRPVDLGSGAATAGADYTASQIISNKVSIVANQSTGEIQIPILDDNLVRRID